MLSRHQALIAVLIAVIGLSTAACATAPAASSAMRLGAVTAPPEAFVDFCRRQPRECGVDPSVGSTSAPIHAATTGPDWAAVFQASESVDDVEATAAAPSAVRWDVPTAATGPAQPVDWEQLFARGEAAERAAEAYAAAPAAPAIDLSAAHPLDAALWARLNRVNSRINRAIVRSTDAEAYGVAELWSLPLESGQRYGDCEDYVLEKRLALINEGVPASALAIAVVETSWGEGHAVLVVTTDRGEYVLDNQTPWILPWSDTTYRWVARQTAGDPFSWALIANS